ncbi:hypothetical protein Tco_0856792, partial [Tanacetum coccineum]
EDRDKELEDEVMHEVLNATQYEEVHAPRDADDGGEQIRDSMANEMWNGYLLYPNNEINADELSKSLKKDIRKDNLQNRLRTLKLSFAKYYDVFRGASLSGFSWDPVTKLMQEEDEVWEALIKEKPDAVNLRTIPIHQYNELMDLFAKDRATSEASETAKERKNQMKQDEQPVETIDEIDQLLQTHYHQKEKKKLEEDAFSSKIMSSLNNLADAIDRTTKVRKVPRPRVLFERKIYQELQLMGCCTTCMRISSSISFFWWEFEQTRALFGFPVEMRTGILQQFLMDENE